MAKRQWRSDDTSPWMDGFGSGSDGALVVSGNTTDSPLDSACTGTAAATALTATNASFAAGQLLLIHQTQGTGAGQWELNKIQSYVAGTITTAYPLIFSYVTGAQVVVMKQYSSVTINTGITLTAKAWNGTVGGILAYFMQNGISGLGTIDVHNIGFRGGTATTNTNANQGESTTGAGTTSTSANGTGGGGETSVGSGGGGGHATSGTGGSGGGQSGAGGTTGGSADLTTMIFGGSGGGSNSSVNSIQGRTGGGILCLFGRNLDFSTLTVVADGTGFVSVNEVSAGAAAGASVLLKGQTILLGANTITALGQTPGLSTINWRGGSSGNGRVHADYSQILTGTTNPTLDSRQDLSYNQGGTLSLNTKFW